MAEIRDRIFRIQRYSVHDGPGIRTTLFFQGCPLSCPWCHNPESQAMVKDSGFENVEESLSYLIREIEKDLIFYDESGGGVTFSGGEPLCQPDLLMGLARACREREIHTCLDTSGFGSKEILEQAAGSVNLVLYDLKIMDEGEHMKLMGKPLEPILDNLKMLSAGKIPVRVRFPLIPGMTDSRENMEKIIEFLVGQTRYRDVHILPFHNTGQGKYDRLNMEYRLNYIQPPGEETISRVRQMFESGGLSAMIGG